MYCIEINILMVTSMIIHYMLNSSTIQLPMSKTGAKNEFIMNDLCNNKIYNNYIAS